MNVKRWNSLHFCLDSLSTPDQASAAASSLGTSVTQPLQDGIGFGMLSSLQDQVVLIESMYRQEFETRCKVTLRGQLILLDGSPRAIGNHPLWPLPELTQLLEAPSYSAIGHQMQLTSPKHIRAVLRAYVLQGMFGMQRLVRGRTPAGAWRDPVKRWRHLVSGHGPAGPTPGQQLDPWDQYYEYLRRAVVHFREKLTGATAEPDLSRCHQHAWAAGPDRMKAWQSATRVHRSMRTGAIAAVDPVMSSTAQDSRAPHACSYVTSFVKQVVFECKRPAPLEQRYAQWQEHHASRSCSQQVGGETPPGIIDAETYASWFAETSLSFFLENVDHYPLLQRVVDVPAVTDIVTEVGGTITTPCPAHVAHWPTWPVPLQRLWCPDTEVDDVLATVLMLHELQRNKTLWVALQGNWMLVFEQYIVLRDHRCSGIVDEIAGISAETLAARVTTSRQQQERMKCGIGMQVSLSDITDNCAARQAAEAASAAQRPLTVPAPRDVPRTQLAPYRRIAARAPNDSLASDVSSGAAGPVHHASTGQPSAVSQASGVEFSFLEVGMAVRGLSWRYWDSLPPDERRRAGSLSIRTNDHRATIGAGLLPPLSEVPADERDLLLFQRLARRYRSGLTHQESLLLSRIEAHRNSDALRGVAAATGSHNQQRQHQGSTGAAATRTMVETQATGEVNEGAQHTIEANRNARIEATGPAAADIEAARITITTRVPGQTDTIMQAIGAAAERDSRRDRLAHAYEQRTTLLAMKELFELGVVEQDNYVGFLQSMVDKTTSARHNLPSTAVTPEAAPDVDVAVAEHTSAELVRNGACNVTQSRGGSSSSLPPPTPSPSNTGSASQQGLPGVTAATRDEPAATEDPHSTARSRSTDLSTQEPSSKRHRTQLEGTGILKSPMHS